MVGDITYISTWEGWLFLATVIDCHTKAVIGWAVDDNYKTPLIQQAIEMAARNYPLAAGAVFHSDRGRGISDAELQIPLGDARVPGRGGSPWPAGIAPIRPSIAETIRLTVLARQHAAGLITRARLAFALRWSLRRRLQQAARWHHYSARLPATTTG